MFEDTKRGNQNPYIEEGQTTQWPKKLQKDKQRSTKHTYKTKDRVTRTPLKTGGVLSGIFKLFLTLVLHVITGSVGLMKGKCSHGGIDDESRKLIAKCGINKETTLEELSPHFHLHNDAYYAAVAATKNFLIAEGKSN